MLPHPELPCKSTTLRQCPFSTDLWKKGDALSIRHPYRVAV